MCAEGITFLNMLNCFYLKMNPTVCKRPENEPVGTLLKSSTYKHYGKKFAKPMIKPLSLVGREDLNLPPLFYLVEIANIKITEFAFAGKCKKNGLYGVLT